MEVFKGGVRPTRIAPKEYFTGTVMQDPIIDAPEPARLRSTLVTFAPGARTAWHTHPYGQHPLRRVGHGPGAGGGWPSARDPRRRRRLVCARREALARRGPIPAWSTSPCRRPRTTAMSTGRSMSAMRITKRRQRREPKGSVCVHCCASAGVGRWSISCCAAYSDSRMTA